MQHEQRESNRSRTNNQSISRQTTRREHEKHLQLLACVTLQWRQQTRRATQGVASRLDFSCTSTGRKEFYKRTAWSREPANGNNNQQCPLSPGPRWPLGCNDVETDGRKRHEALGQTGHNDSHNHSTAGSHSWARQCALPSCRSTTAQHSHTWTCKSVRRETECEEEKRSGQRGVVARRQSTTKRHSLDLASRTQTLTNKTTCISSLSATPLATSTN